MKFTSIQSTALPEITDSIKECVNLGQWFLFRANCDDANVFFFLKTGKDIYALGEHGRILMSTPLQSNVDMDELFFFSDMPRPASLSNSFLPSLHLRASV